jgi:diketogulonate reductase-like aldo/keto reductase
MEENIVIENIPIRKLYTGKTIPSIGLGTFGSDKYTPEQISEAVYGAIQNGYRLIDCASVYQNEKQIGKALHSIINETNIRREDLFIASKLWNDMHRDVERSCKKSIADLQLEYLDLYFVHWPFPNYHEPGCSGDARNPDSKPFSLEEFMDTWRQCEELVDKGLVRHIGMSNMTIPKLELILPHCRIKPAALEMECHPAFQQPELFEYALRHQIQPIGYCPIGSPSRPERDRTNNDVAATQMDEIVEIAKKHDVHPAIICLKWAVQRGQIPIPFSVKKSQYISNLKAVTEDPLTEEEMIKINRADRNCRLIKGQVFLWKDAKGWEDLWDINGVIDGGEKCII